MLLLPAAKMRRMAATKKQPPLSCMKSIGARVTALRKKNTTRLVRFAAVRGSAGSAPASPHHRPDSNTHTHSHPMNTNVLNPASPQQPKYTILSEPFL